MSAQGDRARRVMTRLGRGRQVFGAFIWMGYTETMAYPLLLVLTLANAVVEPLIYFFVGELVTSGPSVGGDYYTFAMIGLVTTFMTQGALQAFGSQLDTFVARGTFETLLVEPVGWRVLPFAMVGWPIVQALSSSTIMMVVGVSLGMQIDPVSIPLALLIIVLGIASAHAVGVLAASVRVLSKRADPVLALYLMASTVLSGVVFPVSLLPEPLRVLSYFLPLTYVLTAMRKTLMVDSGDIAGPTAGEAILLLVVFLIVVYPFGLWLYGRAVEYGRKLGVLAGY